MGNLSDQVILIIAILLLFAVVGVVSLVKGGRAMVRSRRLDAVGRAATGTIVDNQEGGSIYLTMYRPVITYRTDLGQQVTAVGPNEVIMPFTPGAEVPIRCNPDHPTHIEIARGWGRGSGGRRWVIGNAIVTLACIGVILYLIIADPG